LIIQLFIQVCFSLFYFILFNFFIDNELFGFGTNENFQIGNLKKKSVSVANENDIFKNFEIDAKNFKKLYVGGRFNILILQGIKKKKKLKKIKKTKKTKK
jgi:hypothetical protein